MSTSMLLRFPSVAAALFSLVALGGVAHIQAQDNGTKPAGSIGNVDNRTAGSTVRASKLIGMNLYNTNNEGVGEIKDFVLNASTGQVEYVAVTYGGLLGMGNKMFAVPFEAIKYETTNNATSSHRLVLNVTKAQLEGAVGFDEDRWPDFADTKFTDDLYRRYRVERRRMDGNRPARGVDIQADRNGVDIKVDRNK